MYQCEAFLLQLVVLCYQLSPFSCILVVITYECYNTTNCDNIHNVGADKPTKTDEFSEKFQTAFDLFSENHIADFATKVGMFIMVGLLCMT